MSTSLKDLPRPLAFVLGGGASFGAVQVGMLGALEEAGVRPDLVVGTSVGALNGAILATEPVGASQRLEDVWLPMRRRDVFPGNPLSLVWRLQRSGTHAVGAEGLEETIATVVPASTFAELAVPLSVVTLDLVTERTQVVDDGDLVPALLASAAIPGVFEAVDVDGRAMVDGGVLALVPVLQALERGAASMVVLDCTVPTLAPQRARVSDVLTWVTRVQQRAQLEASLPAVAGAVPVVFLPPPPARRVSPFDFDSTGDLVDDARTAAREMLRGLVVEGPGVHGDPFGRYRGAPAADG